jgi:hypothetical protein
MMLLKEKLLALLQSECMELISSHDRLSLPIVERIYKKMSVGVEFGPIKVDGGLIIDGHHRYVASLLAEYSLERIPCPRSSAKMLKKWESVELVEEDWDTSARVKRWNEIDARYIGLTMDEFIEKMK